MAVKARTPSDNARATTTPRLRFAVFGMLADGAGSGAGTFPVLLGELLKRGHAVDFYGVRGFTEPRSLENYDRYGYFGMRLETLERWWWRASKWKTPYPLSVISQLAALGFQRQAVQQIEARRERYDLIFCTDAQAFWRSSLPVISWPQSPPQTEGSALRAPAIRKQVVAASGVGSYAGVQAFYAYRWLVARAAAQHSDVYLCGSDWALREWRRFGVDSNRLRSTPYLIDLEPLATVPPLAPGPRPVTFLWLGRATPRKRLDLFVEAFVRLRQKYPQARARLVGRLDADEFARRILEPHAENDAISVEAPVSRDRVPALFAEIDVLVQPSENENFGFSIAEALAAGRPIVAGPTNGTLEYAGAAGFGFDAYSVDSVAAAMERALLAVGEKGAALSDSARAAARVHFDPASVVTHFEDTCREVVSARSGPRGFGR
jgi:glycosyltransferase involved in cell wall biosynthesis